MEVTMSILKHKKLPVLLGVSLLVSLSSPVQAQWPTLDIHAIKEGIQSKIELVKQSKVVTEATKLGGQMNSTIGDAKSSMSKFAGDNLEKAKEKAEKLKKEKERLEKKKEKLDKAKEKAEKMKKKVEKAKKAMADAKQKVQDAKDMVNDAKQLAADVKSTVADAKATAQGAIADAKSTIADAKATAQGAVASASSAVNDARAMASDTIGSARSQINDARGMVSGTVQRNMPDMAGDTFVDDYVAAYEAGINSDAKMYEAVRPENLSGSMSAVENLGNRNAYSAVGGNRLNSVPRQDISQSVSDEDMQLLRNAGLPEQEVQNILQQPLSDSMVADMREKGVNEQVINNIIEQKSLPMSRATMPTAAGKAPVSANGMTLRRQAFGQKNMTSAVLNKAVSGNLAVPGKAELQNISEPLSGVEVPAKMDSIKDKLSGLKEQVSAAQNKVSAQQAAGTEAASKLGAVKDKLSGLKEQVSAAQNKVSAQRAAGTEAASKLGVVKDKLSGIKDVQPVAKASTVEQSAPVKKGFRQRAVIKNDVQPLDRGSALQTNKAFKSSAVKSSQLLMFGIEDIPDGVVNNGEYDETVMVDTMVSYCGFGAKDLSDETRIPKCMKELIKHMSDKDNQTASEGKAIHNKMVAEAVIAAAGESLALKNTAANYDEKLDKQEEDLGSSSTTRDDSSALAVTNKELQYAINKLLSMSATQLSLDALKQVGGISYSDFGEDDEGEDE